MACVNCRVTSDLNRNQLLGVVRDVAKVVCVVSETWLNEHGNEAMKAEAEDAGYEWTGVGRKGRSGGGVGILIKKDMEWEEVGSFAANVKWIFVKGLGYVAGVYVPPSGSFSNDPSTTSSRTHGQGQ